MSAKTWVVLTANVWAKIYKIAALMTIATFVWVVGNAVMSLLSDEPSGQSSQTVPIHLAPVSRGEPGKRSLSKLHEPVAPPSPTTGIAVDKLPRIGSASPSAPPEPSVPRFSPNLKIPQTDFFCSGSTVIGPSPAIEGWIYAGWHGDNKRWRDTRLHFRRNRSLRTLDGSTLNSLRGSNLRSGPPDWRGKLAKKIGYVDSIMKLQVKEVCPWRRRAWRGAYIWLRVEAIGESRAARRNSSPSGE